MTLAELRTRTRNFLLYDLDSFYGASPSDADLDESINWAIRSLGRRLFLYDPKIAFTVTGTGTYDIESSSFSRTCLFVDKVIINGTILRDFYNRFGLYTLDQLDARYPSWRTTTGTPTAAALSSQLLFLYPAPTAPISGCFVSAQYLPASLSSSGQTPDIPLELHEAIAFLAAFNQALPTATEQEQYERLKAYKSETFELIDQVRSRQFASHRRESSK